MEYTTVKRENPSERGTFLFYPQPVWGAMIGEDELTQEISYASSINASDIRAVIGSLMELIPRHLMNGETVRLEKFGIFRLSFESKGEKLEEDVSAADILKAKILYRPDTSIKNRLKGTAYKKRYLPKASVQQP